ncbi:MAG: cysteine desulfurase-like protein [Candidatus Aminicenantes bacterium]|nr:cysteine desulfurase-like protein [Candidatus Aminicenantes bacterium]
MTLDLTKIRHQFPALHAGALFLDNPGGTQVAKNCLDRIMEYLIDHNANHEGAFKTSRESDALILKARTAMAEFLNAARPEEIVFGQNMTSLTFHLSRSLARRFQAGDEIVVTRLDHDANISPWLLIAQDRGLNVNWVEFRLEDGALDMDSLRAALEKRPKLVALGYASNALGTINPVSEIVKLAHQAGALVFIDAVHFAPHGPIDVQSLGCDFLVCSAYKFFGPHLGILYGRFDLLDELFAYKVRPAHDTLPIKFETGTQNHEAIAGLLGTLEYLEWVGQQFGQDHLAEFGKTFTGRALHLKQAMATIRGYEAGLSKAMFKVLRETPGITIYGLTEENRFGARVPTFSFRLKGLTPRQVSEKLDAEGIYVWDGNYYALEVTRRLGVEESGGMVRAGAVHYNTLEEIERFGKALHKLAHAS